MIFSMPINFQCNCNLNQNIDAFHPWKLDIVPISLKGHCNFYFFCELMEKLVNIFNKYQFFLIEVIQIK
jgi:hypothetical protein